MLTWCGVLFFLGILAFIDSIFSMGEIFRRVNSVLFLLISLGLLIRTTTKIKEQKVENYEKRVFALERQIQALEKAREKVSDY